MSKCFQPCPPEVRERVDRMAALYHAPLIKEGVTFDLLFVIDPDDEDKPVLSHHGCPALAVGRLVPVKDRVKGCADVEICIDQRRYEEADPAERDALLDHELEHLMLKTKNGETAAKRDNAGRPCLQIKKHDFDFGWFESTARRHKAASIEVRQAGRLWVQQQTFFPFATP